MSDFEVLVVGVGDSFSERHSTSAILLRAQGRCLAIDCPDPYRKVLKSAADRAGVEVPAQAVDEVLITHVHGDHMNGLEGFTFFKHFAESKRLTLLCSPEVRGVIWDERLRASMGTLWDGQGYRSLDFEDYFDYCPLPFGAEVERGPFRIRTRQTIHHVPTSALLIESSGRTLGYSSDTAFDPVLIDFLSAADLIIHETNYGPAHTPYESLAALPAELRAKMRLIHYSDRFDLRASLIETLSEGQRLTV